MTKGKLIVFYGVNNLGKSTQAKLLVEKLAKEGRPAKYLKYHAYDLEPSGPIINDYLRKGNPYGLTPREFQLMAAFNKSQYEPNLVANLASGINIVAEDYWGTSIAWGVAAGVDKEYLMRINKAFHREDLAFVFHGKRYAIGIEDGHKHETNDDLIEKANEIHFQLAGEFGWQKIDANQDIETISNLIWNKVKSMI